MNVLLSKNLGPAYHKGDKSVICLSKGGKLFETTIFLAQRVQLSSPLWNAITTDFRYTHIFSIFLKLIYFR